MTKPPTLRATLGDLVAQHRRAAEHFAAGAASIDLAAYPSIPAGTGRVTFSDPAPDDPGKEPTR